MEEISALKNEPDWMLQYRLRAYEHFLKRPMPTWGGDLGRIDFGKIVYYRKPSEREEKSWDDVPEQIKATFEKLGIPEAERKFLAGVGAQYDSEVVYHSVREELSKLGVVFMGTDQGLKEYPEIFRKHFGTVVPPEDNKFSALNAAVWSGGSFVYVPKGVDVPLPLQAYFRINGENTGQFERTLIVVDEGASVHYIEGCTAPIYATDSLHAAVVEVVALPGSKVRYTTIQNWSNDVYNLVTKRAHAHENARVEWIDANTGSKLTMKYPSIYLRGRGATADIISVAVAGKDQHQDTGAKAVHLAPDTKSRIVSKSVSKDGGRATYRGHIKVAPGATNVIASVRCDALMLDAESPQRHVPVHRHPGGRHHPDPRGHGGQDLRGPGVLPDEPRPDGERGAEPHRAGLPRGVHQGAPDGVRDRVQPPGQAGDGRVARVSVKPLELAFVSETIAAELSANLGEPDWLRDERDRGGAASWPRCPPRPTCSTRQYLDLRAARFGEIEVYPSAGVAPGGEGDLPDGAAAYLHVRENAVVERALSPVARDAGLFLGTFEEALRDRPDVLRRTIEGGASLPADDAFAQVARAVATLGLLIHVPGGPVAHRAHRAALGPGHGRSRARLAHGDLARDAAPARRSWRSRETRTRARARAPSRSGGAPARSTSRTAPRCRSPRSRTSTRRRSRSSTVMPASVRGRTLRSRSRAWVAGCTRAASTTSSSGTARRSTRWRSGSAPATSCST